MKSFDLQQDFFSLFNLPARFQIDTALLEQQYRALQAQVHPDKFSHLSEGERRLSVQWATRVNEGYQALRDPLHRARYLLTLHGVDTQEESNTAMPAEFLMQRGTWPRWKNWSGASSMRRVHCSSSSPPSSTTHTTTKRLPV
jgi:molecular chaperone HscB